MKSSLKLRDRDAIISKEGIIFRVYGYFHPSESYVCDPEYASAKIYQSTNSRAPRGVGRPIYYKFYFDEGLHFVQKKFPVYTIFYEPFQRRLVGVQRRYVVKIGKPDDKFQKLIAERSSSSLIKRLRTLSRLIISRSGLSERDFGVFGSILHDFHHPKFSDIDLIVYGKEKLDRLCEILKEIYQREGFLENEFDSDESIEGKLWKFKNYRPKQYVWHQQRKLIYALFKEKRGRIIKVEFEPVKDWSEIHNEYDSNMRILNKGWIKAVARITEDKDSPFIPSIYGIQIIDILEGPKVEDIERIISYVEEFRMQAKRDERVYVEGNLEEVRTKSDAFHQITLTYISRYYEQSLRVL